MDSENNNSKNNNNSENSLLSWGMTLIGYPILYTIETIFENSLSVYDYFYNEEKDD